MRIRFKINVVEMKTKIWTEIFLLVKKSQADSGSKLGKNCHQLSLVRLQQHLSSKILEKYI